jgi:hypothetical protein
MLGMGCFLYYYWSQGEPVSMVAALGAGIGLFICTVTLNLTTLIGFALGGMCSMAYLAWTVWSAAHG